MCGLDASDAIRETFIQLWDIEEENKGTCRRANSSPSWKVEQKAGFDPQAKLTFETSDGVRSMQIYRVERMESDKAAIHVYLAARPSSCKPRDRLLHEQQSYCAPKLSSLAAGDVTNKA